VSYFGGSSGMVGDPGFFGSLFGGVKGGVRGFFRGGLIGTVRGAAEGFRGAGRPVPSVPFIAPTPRAALIPEIATGLGVGAGTVLAERALASGANGCANGFHLNKSSYFLRNGTFVPEGSRCVRNRRRNQYNRSAATKAASRLKSLGTGLKTIKKSVGAASRGLGNKS